MPAYSAAMKGLSRSEIAQVKKVAEEFLLKAKALRDHRPSIPQPDAERLWFGATHEERIFHAEKIGNGLLAVVVRSEAAA